MIKVQAQRLPTTQHTLPTQPPDEQARPPAPRPQHTKHARYEEGELLSTRQYVVQARVARGSSTPAHTLDESSCGLLHATTLPPCTCLHCRGGGGDVSTHKLARTPLAWGRMRNATKPKSAHATHAGTSTNPVDKPHQEQTVTATPSLQGLGHTVVVTHCTVRRGGAMLHVVKMYTGNIPSVSRVWYNTRTQAAHGRKRLVGAAARAGPARV